VLSIISGIMQVNGWGFSRMLLLLWELEMAANQIVQGFNNKNIHKLMMAMVGRLTLQIEEVISNNKDYNNFLNNNREG